MDPRATAEMLTAWALEAGFDRAGVAGLEPSAQGAAFLRWIERGDQAGMHWFTKRVEARLEPSRVWPGTRSVLCVAFQYSPLSNKDGEEIPEPGGDLWPRVARYARGLDYHEVMQERLTVLEARIAAAFPGLISRRYVDTGPVLERELASRAGLGVQGKNTMLLHPEGGSYFLLGEIFLSLELAPEPALDNPLADLCGSCTRCVDGCPTGALREPYRLDSNLCISYWTIEHRGSLPAGVREMVGSWVFGCDVCQMVCPWNEAPARASHPEMEIPPQRAGLDLAGLLLLGRDEYVERFRGSPMKRAKLEGLQRNAAVAMGNRRQPRYVAPLAEALAQGEPVVRAHAAWALGRIPGEEARRVLEVALQREGEAAVVAEIRQALGRSGAGKLEGDSGPEERSLS